jgi:hypothetical protein
MQAASVRLYERLLLYYTKILECIYKVRKQFDMNESKRDIGPCLFLLLFLLILSLSVDYDASLKCIYLFIETYNDIQSFLCFTF